MKRDIDTSFIIDPETGINDDQGVDGDSWPDAERPVLAVSESNAGLGAGSSCAATRAQLRQFRLGRVGAHWRRGLFFRAAAHHAVTARAGTCWPRPLVHRLNQNLRLVGTGLRSAKRREHQRQQVGR